MTGLERHLGVLELAAQMLAGDRLLCYRPIHTAFATCAPVEIHTAPERSTSEPATPARVHARPALPPACEGEKQQPADREQYHGRSLFESAHQHAARSAGADRGRPRRDAAAQKLRDLERIAAP